MKILKEALTLFKSKKKMPIAIIGLRRIGKTELIQKFREKKEGILMPYLNLQGSTSSPETFTQDFYLSLLEEIAAYKKVSFAPIGSKREKIISLSSILGEDIYRVSMEFLNTLESRDYHEMLKIAFRIPEKIAESMSTRSIFFLDEFQDLEELNNYRFGDVFKVMRSVVEKQRNVMYVISGSVISFMEHLIRDSRKPFFNQFRMLGLSYFTKEDSLVLIKGLMEDYSIGGDSMLILFKYTLGHPFYITAVCERIVMESNGKIDENLVRYSLIKETLDKNGKINILFGYIFEESLKKAKRRGYLQNILTILAEDEGLTLTQISEILGKPTGQVSNYMKSLLRTDLVFEQEKRYFYRDPLFRFWVAKTQLGKDMEIERGRRYVDDYLKELKEKYLRASSELGKAKEFEFKAKLEERLKIKLKNYRKGNIEFDLIGKKNEIPYIFEIKYRNKPATYKDLKNFLEKVKNSEFSSKPKKHFFISKSFTEKALKFASKNDISLLDEKLKCPKSKIP